MEKNPLDWYTYLAEEFKVARHLYRVNDPAVFLCPECQTTKIVRVQHAKEKIAKLRTYVCSACRKRAAIVRARKACSTKYEGKNPFQLDSVKEKIRQTNVERYGMECLLSGPVRQTGVEKIQRIRAENRGFEYPDLSGLSPNEKSKAYDKIRNKLDKTYNLRKRVYSFINRALQQANAPIDSKTKLLKSLDYSVDDLVVHLEKQFQPGMSWENRSEWHVDHIVPLCKFDLQSIDGIKEANALRNLRPIWKHENLTKRAFLPVIFMVVGCFGAGKTTLCAKLAIPAFSHDLGHDEIDVAKSASKAVTFETAVNIGSYLKRFRKYFDVKLVVIQEPRNTLVERAHARGGSLSETTISNRSNRMVQLAKEAEFSGTAVECEQYLRNQLTFKRFV